MKKTILLLLPLLLTTACSHTKIIERPEIALNSSTNYLSLERVVCTPEATRLDLTVCCIPGKGFSIEKEAYLQSRESGLKYVLTGAEGIEPGKTLPGWSIFHYYSNRFLPMKNKSISSKAKTGNSSVST